MFDYDHNGKRVAFRNTDGAIYFYVYNLQGDVVQLLDSSRNVVGEYVYGPYGYLENSSSLSTVAQANPFRYRGYYYDTENGYYYLNARYYYPVFGRFISADIPETTFENFENFAQYNLFAYCFNNPINNTDESGNWPSWATKVIIGTVVIAAAAALTVATAGTAAPAIACFATGALHGAISGALIGAASGGAMGAVIHRVSTGSWKGAGKAALEGAADGYMSGAITGFIVGGLTSSACFIAGTVVLTSAGLVAIENIQTGDMVWASDPVTGETALKEVVQTFVNETSELVHITFANEEIVCTNEHPFYVAQKGWTAACKLRAGDILVTVNGEYVVVEIVQHEILETPIKVYNFEVEDYHTYFVGTAIVLVHNQCTGSYEIEFKSGKNYVGKGSKARMNVSARSHARIYNDPVVKSTWSPASNAKNAFVDEYFKMAVRGVNNANTYNKIWSPGRKIFMKAIASRL